MRLSRAVWITASPFLAERDKDSSLGQMVALAAQRCDTIGEVSYVDGPQERWHAVTVPDLVRDVQEELADAAAYCSALHQKTGDERWAEALPLLSQVWALTQGPLPTTSEEVV